MGNEIPLILSVPTSGGGATAAATYAFMTSGYQMPRQERSTAQDLVHNHNGLFKYRYDNGPGPRIWRPFRIELNDRFTTRLGVSATVQYQRLLFLWRYTEGPLTMQAPEGIYAVDWAAAPLEPQFKSTHPAIGNDQFEIFVDVNLEEG